MFAGFGIKLLKRLSCVDRVWKRDTNRGTFENRGIKVSARYGVLNDIGLRREYGEIRVPKYLCFSLKASIARCKSRRLLRVGRFSVVKR